jgi:hypothetical protein
VAYRRRRPRRLPKNALKIAAAVVVLLVLGFGVAWGVPRLGLTFPWEASRAKRVTTALAANPSLTNFYGPLRQYFPDDYRELSRGVASLSQRGASSGEIAQYSFLAMRAFVANHMQDISSAPTPILVRIAKSQATVARILSHENPVACAQYGVTGLKAETLAKLSPAVRANIGAGVRATIEAAHRGRTSPITRDPQLSEEDTNLLVSAIAQSGLTEQQMQLLTKGGIDKASAVDQCQVTRALYEVVARMPAEKSAQLTSSLLRRSTQPDAEPVNQTQLTGLPS